MKLKVIIISSVILAGAFIVFQSVFNGSTDTYRELLLENIEALADDGENELGVPNCWGEGSVDCPKEGKTGDRVKYLSIRNEVSLY